MADVTMADQFEWAFPKEWITVIEMEDDESSLDVKYEVVDTTKVLEIAALLYAGGSVPHELLTERILWVTKLKDAMQPDGDEPLTLEETLEGVTYWVNEELNATMESYAEEKLAGYKDGSEWENYYD